MMDYQQFIQSKRRKLQPMGFEVAEESLNSHLFDWQRRTVHWALRRGRAALFEECVSASTVVHGPDGDRTIRELADSSEPLRVWSLDQSCNPKVALAIAPRAVGKADLYRIQLKSGRFVEVTRGHRFMTPSAKSPGSAGRRTG